MTTYKKANFEANAPLAPVTLTISDILINPLSISSAAKCNFISLKKASSIKLQNLNKQTAWE